MKNKNILLIIVFILSIFFCTSLVFAQGLVKGSFVEVIDDVEHEKIIEYGKPGLFTVEEMLSSMGIVLNSEDKIETFPDPSFGIGSKIVILRATTVVVEDAGEIKTYRTWKTNLGDFLDENNIKVGEDDVMNFKKSDILQKDMNLVITRVSMSEYKEYESIGHKIVYENDPTLERGKTAVKQVGKDGKKELVYMLRRENGKEIERKFVSTSVVEEPINKIILKGTKVIVLDKGMASYVSRGIYSGYQAAHKTLPMGSKVLVRASNAKEVIVTIVDRGPFIEGRVIDLSYEAFVELAGGTGVGVIYVTLEKP